MISAIPYFAMKFSLTLAWKDCYITQYRYKRICWFSVLWHCKFQIKKWLLFMIKHDTYLNLNVCNIHSKIWYMLEIPLYQKCLSKSCLQKYWFPNFCCYFSSHNILSVTISLWQYAFWSYLIFIHFDDSVCILLVIWVTLFP